MDQNDLKEAYHSVSMTGQQNRKALEYVRTGTGSKQILYRKAAAVLAVILHFIKQLWPIRRAEQLPLVVSRRQVTTLVRHVISTNFVRMS